MKKFPHFTQLGFKDCGPTCIKIIAKWHRKNYSLDFLRQKCSLNKIGVSLRGISEAAEAIGFHTTAAKLSIAKLVSVFDDDPCILHWSKNHFVVLYKIRKGVFSNKLTFFYK